MSTANEVVKVAAGEVGSHEQPPGSNRTPYGRYYGLDGVPWCAQFLWWVVNKAGRALWPKTAYTPTLAQFFVDEGRWTQANPRRGDLVFFNFPDSLNRIQHVGLVTDVNGRTIRTIEGNTSSGDSGSQDNGDGVYRRTRSSYIVGYGRPAYRGAGGHKPKGKRQRPKHRVYLNLGDTGADVVRWQRDLNRWANSRGLRAIREDGMFGPATTERTLAFQRWGNLSPDGIAGPATLRRMEAWRD